MHAVNSLESQSSALDTGEYVAAIPAATFKRGDMVRWYVTVSADLSIEGSILSEPYSELHSHCAVFQDSGRAGGSGGNGDMLVQATDANQQASRLPPLGKADRYFGTVISDPSVSFNIPVMEW